MDRRLGWLALAAGLACAGPALAAPAKCNLMKMAELPVSMQGPRPIVTVKINGKPARLVVDSGAFFSSLDVDAFDKFDLKRAPVPIGMVVRGVGGVEQIANGRALSFELGDFKLQNYEFMVASRYGAADGLLGENILGGVDDEFDFANGVVRLFRTENCGKANLAYWAADKAVSELPLIRSDESHAQPIVRAKVNGREIRVMLDTGASYSVLRRETAEKLGFKPNAEGVTEGGLSGGLGRNLNESWIAPFASFEIGSEKITNTKLRVSELGGMNEIDMLLGADFFLSHRVYVARSQNQVLITYNGGPVFRLERIAPGSGRPPERPIAAAPAAGNELKTADEYVRRGKASMSRRDLAGAIADFSRAIDLEPNDPAHYYDRGLAHVAARQPVMALADLEKTLSLKPDQLDALLARGELFLQRGQIPRARADFTAAEKIAGNDGDAHLRIASDYLRAGFSQEAVAQYNDWFAAHPDRRNDAGVLNDRCFARALGNRELDLALADCNASIKASDNSAYLDSRGMAYLRMGQYDKAIADYDASLKKQPKSAWPLYGRGLAKLKKGLDEAGKADIREAMSIAPAVILVANRYGLNPPPGTIPNGPGGGPPGVTPVNP